MSLNGLDAPELKEAHDAAAAEPGGWFLLQYAGRDAVELLGKGGGGIVEIRNAIAQYEEPSPLYGFLRYRRRNVIVKYLPDNCSRLIQARVTVHLDSVCERFSPHDTVFEIAAAKELKDTRLSAACLLHTASGSMSSSTSSLRRRRLMEIAEEEEEEQRATKRQSVGAADEADRPSSPAEPPVALDPALATSPEASQFSGAAEPPAFVGVPRPASPAESLDASGSGYFQAGRSDYSGYHSSSPFSARPKVKLGPRPSLDTSGRPRTAAGSTFRPVSTIPAGFKMMSKTGKKDRPQGADEEHVDTDDLDNPTGETPPISSLQAGGLVSMEHLPTPDTNSTSPPRPHTSGGRSTIATSGIKAVPASTAKPGPAGPGMMSPEKSRLMKAMQLREKKKKEQEALMASTSQAESGSDGSSTAADKSDVASPHTDDKVDESPSVIECPQQGQAAEEAKGLGGTSGVAGEDQMLQSSRDETPDEVSSLLLPDRSSVDAQTDSHPASPLVASSEIGNSTKASSVSESTDETALESKGGIADSTTDSGDERPGTATPAAADGDTTSMGPQQPGQPEEMASAMLNTTNAPCAGDGGAHSDASTSATRGILRHTGDTVENAESEHVLRAPSGTLEAPLLRTPTYDFPEVAREEEQPRVTTESPRGSIRADRPSTGDEPGPTTGPEADLTQAELESKRSRRLRLAGVQPIQIGLGAGVAATAGATKDEELVDEMHSATLHEAGPMLVSKSPITPVFPPAGGGACNNGSSSPVFDVSGADGPGTAVAPARNATRAVSNPTSNGQPAGVGEAPQLQPPANRAVSSGPSFLQKVAQQRPGSSSSVASASGSTAAKKLGMGSSISQRIKALEKLSSSSGGLATPSSVPERPQSAFFSVRPTSVREPSRSPSVAERASSLRVEKNTPSTPQPQDREGLVAAMGGLRDRSGSISSRLSVFEGGSVPRGRPDSIQVTARIVRDPLQSLQKAVEPPRADVAEPAPLDLKQSPLVVDHHRPTTSPSGGMLDVATEPRKTTILQRRLSRDQRRSQMAEDDEGAVVDSKNNGESEATTEDSPRRRSSLTIVKDFIKDRRSSVRDAMSPSTDNLSLGPGAASPSRSPSRPPSTHHNSVFPRRLSISSRRSSISKDRDGVATPLLSPTRTADTSGSGDEAMGRIGGNDSQKKNGKSRASRFIRRLSNSLSSSRKVVSQTRSPTVTEEAFDGEAGRAMAGAVQQKQPVVVADMGDVNVQFPDNLLWKRRAMCLDSQGFLILSAGQTAAAAGSIVTKRYHLSEFKAPYAPEMEQQELPNSVCLDFVDGSSLQIACEDRVGQVTTLQELHAAHQNHTTFGQ
ncbi:hypothetical protein RB595_001272 [Gaeumannomyces hyphopodioides]